MTFHSSAPAAMNREPVHSGEKFYFAKLWTTLLPTLVDFTVYFVNT